MAAAPTTIEASADSKTQITVCTWNINGDERAALRKKVTKTTINHQNRDGTRLSESDIICVQEMTAKPAKPVAHQQYLSLAECYEVVESKQPEGNIYNAVYYNKEKFNQIPVKCLDRAYNLMEHKKACYDRIQQGDIENAKNGELSTWGESKDERKMCKEVLRECHQLGKFNISKYMYQRPRRDTCTTENPRDLLNYRMAICVLEIKSLPGQHIVAVSVHNYSKRSGRNAPGNYARLLFDFLSKLRYTGLNHIVVIAGDFNFNIGDHEPSLKPYLDCYHIPKYKLTPLRKTTIDFIMVTKLNDTFDITMRNVKAHDLQVPPEVENQGIGGHRKITNHSPISAVVELNQCMLVLKLFRSLSKWWHSLFATDNSS